MAPLQGVDQCHGVADQPRTGNPVDNIFFFRARLIRRPSTAPAPKQETLGSGSASIILEPTHSC